MISTLITTGLTAITLALGVGPTVSGGVNAASSGTATLTQTTIAAQVDRGLRLTALGAGAVR